MLHSFLNVIHIFVCFFLILVVLLQQGKGGGLGGLGGASAAQVFGGRGAGNFMTRLTGICAAVFMITSMVLAYISSGGDRAVRELQEMDAKNPILPAPAATPTSAPVQAPAPQPIPVELPPDPEPAPAPAPAPTQAPAP